MESEILGVAEDAVNQPGVTGYICIDENGLCIAAKGQASQTMSGIIKQFADLATKIEDTNEPPVIRVDMEQRKIVIQSRDSITTALISPQK